MQSQSSVTMSVLSNTSWCLVTAIKVSRVNAFDSWSSKLGVRAQQMKYWHAYICDTLNQRHFNSGRVSSTPTPYLPVMGVRPVILQYHDTGLAACAAFWMGTSESKVLKIHHPGPEAKEPAQNWIDSCSPHSWESLSTSSPCSPRRTPATRLQS